MSTKIVKRILIEGDLELMTPASLGNGDISVVADMPLARDPKHGHALLTGASLAGALRSYLRECEEGYAHEAQNTIAQLFGEALNDDTGKDSPLVISDTWTSEERPDTELRDGVAIDPITRTAEDGKKFDAELLAAGTKFILRFELQIAESDNSAEMISLLATALAALQRGEVRLGARKRRGLGECQVSVWRVCTYDLSKPQMLIAWLKQDQSAHISGENIISLLDSTLRESDVRERFVIEAKFAVNGSLMIRSGGGQSKAPDAEHLHSNNHSNKDVPIVSGTALAGALRARALRIVNTLNPSQDDICWKFIDRVFGMRQRDKADKSTVTASRLLTSEVRINQAIELTQSRIKIDRFTGSGYPGALFSERVAFGNSEGHTTLLMRLELRKSQSNHDFSAEIGLLLLLLKDLWIGDLTIGGESNVGRGRLKGLSATLTYQHPHPKPYSSWEILAGDGSNQLVLPQDSDVLQGYVDAFVDEVSR